MLDQIGNSDLGDFGGEDVGNLSSDFLDLRVLGIAGLSLLSLSSLGETDGENTENVSIVGLDVTLAFNGGLPFSNHRAELISGGVHSVEGGLGGGSLALVDDELDLSPGEVLGSLLKITERGFNDSSLKNFSGDLCSESLSYKCFSERSG